MLKSQLMATVKIDRSSLMCDEVTNIFYEHVKTKWELTVSFTYDMCISFCQHKIEKLYL